MKKKLFEKNNYTLIGLSLALLMLGYFLLSQGPVDNPLSKSVAPVILVVTYCAILPYAILSGFRKTEKEENRK